jgi:hypothetical protein
MLKTFLVKHDYRSRGLLCAVSRRAHPCAFRNQLAVARGANSGHLCFDDLSHCYAVMIETGFSKAEIGKIIVAACFINDLGTAVALVLWLRPTR